jgi:hypothetical protein
MARWLGEDGGVRGTATSPGRAAPSVEDRQLDSAPHGQGGEGRLRAVDLPLGGQVAAVLAGVGVPDHHLDAAVAREARIVEQGFDDLWRRPQVIDRLEQRAHT